jgi:hypothetical protein
MIIEMVLIGVFIMFLTYGYGNVTNSTSDCPENYYGGDDTGMYDLLDRWCDGSDKIIPPID